jgi:hypothetical protein
MRQEPGSGGGGGAVSTNQVRIRVTVVCVNPVDLPSPFNLMAFGNVT